MSAPMRSKLSKTERKLRKKIVKSSSIVLKYEGIESVESPTKILCVSNAGLDNNVTQDEVYHLFSCHGTICDVIMLPRKPYAFVCYINEEDAESACEALNGHTLAATENRKEEITLYIFFVSKAPASIQPSKALPPGLILLENFISDDYTAEIMSSIDWDMGTKDQEKELKHRRVKHYGYEFKYSINNVDPDEPLEEGIPEVYRKLLDKALETGHVKFYPDQLTINQYQPGQGIPPHVDTTSAFEDGLMSLSIGSQVNMEFRHPDGRQLSVLLPPNSLLIMTGESRYVWSHGIRPRKYDIVLATGGGLTLSARSVRTSFTFRKITGVRPGEITSLQDNREMVLSNADAAELEKEHVHQVYEEIAGHFSGTRHTPWPNIVEFLQKLEPGTLLADFGCGNGKYFGINKSLFEIGSDRSFNLVDICKDRKFEVFVGDVLSIPLRTGVLDVCLCIAVIHHLATEARRIKAIHELVRILRVGGKALIYVWAMEQELNKVKSKYLKKGQSSGVCDNESHGHTCMLSENVGGTYSEDQKANLDARERNCECINDSQINNTDGDRRNAKLDNACKNVCDSMCEDKGINSVYDTHFNDIVEEKCDGTIQCNYINETLKSADSVAQKMETIKITENETQPDACNKQIINDTADISKSDTGANIKNGDRKYQVEKASGKKKTKLPVHVNRTEFKQQDLLVPWQLKGKTKVEKESKSESTFHRFYHVFKKGELELLCSKVPDCMVVHSYYDQGNWAVILEKL